MGARDLTTLAVVKQYLGLSDSSSDPILSTLISQLSSLAHNKTSRSFFLPKTVTELLDGSGGTRLLLTNYPVQSVSLLQVDGVTVPPASSPTGSGWILEPASDDPPGVMQRLDLRGYGFSRGTRNVSVTYTAGYLVADEAAVATASVVVAAPYGRWRSDMGVVRASDRSALVNVSSAPAAGQYTVNALGGYSFNASDDGLAVLISYGFIPYDLEQAVTDWVAERFKYKDRIGYRSKSLGGAETVSFDNRALPDSVGQVLQTYTRVVSC